jgi:ribosome-associated protein
MADDSFPFEDDDSKPGSAPASPSASATCTPCRTWARNWSRSPPSGWPESRLPDALREALREAQRLSRHEARRRQLQYIGRLMRDIDPAPIRAALDALNGVSAVETARQHRLERLRERLLEDESVLTEVGADHPGADLTRLRQLRRTALHEREAGKPPRAFSRTVPHPAGDRR